MTEEQRQRRSRNAKNRLPMSEETRQKCINALIGRPVSDKTRKKISDSHHKSQTEVRTKFKVIRPDGTEEILENVSKFARDMNWKNGDVYH